MSVLPVEVQVPEWPFSQWCNCRAKRLFDLSSSTVLLIAASPVMLLAAALIRVTAPGPIFFRHVRLGRFGRKISVLKFRTMVHRPTEQGPGVTRSGDSRVTSIGRLLRKWKLDELPQLINVLRGEMSMVGPRPDLEQYFARITPEERTILLLAPGITSPATLVFRNEERLLGGVAAHDIETFYCTAILPAKVNLEKEYATKATFMSDLGVLMQTVAAVLWGREKPTPVHDGSPFATERRVARTPASRTQSAVPRELGGP